MNEENNSVNNLDVATQEDSQVISDTSVVEETKETQETEKDTSIAETTQVEDSTEKQSREDNSAARNARIRAEKEAERKIKEAYEKGLNDAKIKQYIGKVNPYTNKVVEDELDVQQLQDMMEIDDSGGDPLVEYAVKIKEREKAKIIKEHENLKKQEQVEKLNKEITELTEKHPNLDVQALLQDENFNCFAQGKVGQQPINQIYEDYSRLQNFWKEKSDKAIQEEIAKQNSSSGSLAGGTQEVLDFEKMSSEDFKRYRQKILDE